MIAGGISPDFGSIYINGEAFHDLLDDLVADLETITCDVVGGLDAM